MFRPFVFSLSSFVWNRIILLQNFNKTLIEDRFKTGGYCIANADQNLSYYVKYVLFILRANPQPANRVLHGQIQKKIQDALEWGKQHLTLPNLTVKLADKIEQYLAWLPEQSADGMSIAEEHRTFIAACCIVKNLSNTIKVFGGIQ